MKNLCFLLQTGGKWHALVGHRVSTIGRREQIQAANAAAVSLKLNMDTFDFSTAIL